MNRGAKRVPLLDVAGAEIAIHSPPDTRIGAQRDRLYIRGLRSRERWRDIVQCPLAPEARSWEFAGTISGTVSTASEALSTDSRLRERDAVNVSLRSTAREHVRSPGV
jgi:hypothetical protein